MCLLCLEFEKGRLTRFEMQQAYSELLRTGADPEHLLEISELIEDMEEDEDAT